MQPPNAAGCSTMLLLTHGRGRRLPHPERQIHRLIVHDEARSLVAVSASPLSPASRRPILQTRSSLVRQQPFDS